jgi:hypothetical protein
MLKTVFKAIRSPQVKHSQVMNKNNFQFIFALHLNYRYYC